MGELYGDGGLADPALAVQAHRCRYAGVRAVGEQLHALLGEHLPPAEISQFRRQHHRGRGRATVGLRPVRAQQLPVQVLQPQTRLHTEFRGDQRAPLVVHPECVVAAPDPVLRLHQQGAQPLPEGMGHELAGKLGSNVGRVRCCQRALRPVLQRADAQFVQLRGRGADRRYVNSVIRRSAAPVDRAPERGLRPGLVTGLPQCPPVAQVGPKRRLVQAVLRHGQQIARWLRPQQGTGRTQGLAQPGHVVLDLGAGGVRWILRPELLDEHIAGYDGVRVRQQHAQHCLPQRGGRAGPARSRFARQAGRVPGRRPRDARKHPAAVEVLVPWIGGRPMEAIGFGGRTALCGSSRTGGARCQQRQPAT